MDDRNEDVKKAHVRSASYPSINLEEAIEFATSIYTTFSKATVKREELSISLKNHVNTISRKVASCVQFGLLDKTTGDGYTVTQLYIDIFKPDSIKDRKIKILQAFGSPKLFQELINKFDGHVIPHEMPNTLVKYHNISENAAAFAAEIFLQSGQFVEAISDNRQLRYRDTLAVLQKTQFAEVVDIEQGSYEENISDKSMQIKLPSQENSISADEKRVPIYLTKDKVAYFQYPSTMTEKDVEIVKHQLDGILLRIKYENE